MKPGPKPRGTVLLEWSPSFAYAIGLITADGCLVNDGRHLNFTSKDLVQVSLFKECLNLKTKIGTKRSGAGNLAYCIQFGDVLFYQFLLTIGLTPAKSKTIESVQIPDKYFPDFLRGYFDGDGSSSSFYDSVWKKSYRFYISFVSASPVFIDWLRMELDTRLGIKGHISRWKGKSAISLKYAKREALILSEYIYRSKSDLFLKRKYLKIERSISIIGTRRSGEIGRHAAFRSQSSKGVGGSNPLSGTR